MIGKQDIHMSLEELNIMAEKYDMTINSVFITNDSFDVFKNMGGVEKVSALDFSDYEGADILLDLNTGLLEEAYKGQYDLVIDGGTLEHIFNQYNAINVMNALVA